MIRRSKKHAKHGFLDGAAYRVVTHSPAETIRLGRMIAQHARPGLIIFLDGDLGSGKTVLAKGIARGLGVKEEITSSSFVIATEYTGKMRIVHLDLYRLDNNDIGALPIEEYFAADGVTMVEWSERLISPDRRKPKGVHIRFIVKGTREREITIENSRD